MRGHTGPRAVFSVRGTHRTLLCALVLATSTCALAVTDWAAGDGDATAAWGDTLHVSVGTTFVPREDSLPGPRPVTFDFKSVSSGPNDSQPRDPRLVILRFPRGLRYNGALFPQCKVRAAPRCPRGSRLGSGYASVHIGGSDEQTPVKLKLFNGPLRNGNPTELYYADAGWIKVRFLGVFKRDLQGPWGLKETFNLKKIFGDPPLVTIRRFDVRTRNLTVVRHTSRGRRRVPIFAGPATCTGSLSSAYDYVFSSGELLRAVDEEPCPPPE